MMAFAVMASSVAGAEVGEGDNLAAEEDFHSVVEPAESAGGEPEEFRKDFGADDRNLFGFNQSDGKIRAEGAGALRTDTGIASKHRASDVAL